MKEILQIIDSYLVKFTTYMDFYLVKKLKYFSKVHFILEKKNCMQMPSNEPKCLLWVKERFLLMHWCYENCCHVACCSWPILNVRKMNFCHFPSKNPNTCIHWHVHQCSSTCQHIYIHCVSRSSRLAITITIIAFHYLS